MNPQSQPHGAELSPDSALDSESIQNMVSNKYAVWHDVCRQDVFSSVQEQIDATDHGASLIDARGFILQANKSFSCALAHDISEIIGANIFSVLPEDSARLWRHGLTKAAESGRSIRLEMSGNDGMYEHTVYPVGDAKREHNRFFIVSRDITEKKLIEKERADLQAHLLQSQKMEAIGTLAGGIAHDFNNILMGIQGYVSLLLHDLKKNHHMYEKLKCIEAQIESGATLTKQLLGFARVGPHETRPTNLNAFLAEKAKMFHRAKKDVLLHFDLCPSLWTVRIDPHQIEQVFLNLFINAWQAMPEEGEVHLETRNIYLHGDELNSMGINPGPFVRISLSDTGMGIDPMILPRIFDPFFTTKKIGRGTGLGLASAYGIIRSHGGHIRVNSIHGKGTTFFIYLPAVDSPPEEKMRRETEGALSGREGILIVDDERQIISVLKEMLEILGYRIFAAGCGQEAIAVYKEKHDEIDLIILDMIMPGMGGGKAFTLLKEINPKVRIILATGYSVNNEIQKIMARGCNGFLSKPFKLDELSREIRGVLDSPVADQDLHIL